MLENEMVEVRIPFEGFYNTISQSIVGDAEFRGWCYANDKEYNDESEMNDDDNRAFYLQSGGDEYKALEKDFLSQYIDNFFTLLESKSGILVKRDNTTIVLVSPRQYNFSTDRIFVKVEKKYLLALLVKVDKSKLAKKIKDEFTSYDGFLSHYDNDLSADDWQAVEKFDHNQWCTVFECFLERGDLSDMICYDITL